MSVVGVIWVGKAEGRTEDFEKKYDKLIKRYERASTALEDTKAKLQTPILIARKWMST